LWTTLVKSFSDTQPDLGLASGPVDVQRYVDGRVQVVGGLVVVEVGGLVVVEVGGLVVVLGPVVGTTTPVQVTPLRAKLDGTGLLPVHDPLKPNDVDPLVGIEPL
jgi:hypothetical protein